MNQSLRIVLLWSSAATLIAGTAGVIYLRAHRPAAPPPVVAPPTAVHSTAAPNAQAGLSAILGNQKMLEGLPREKIAQARELSGVLGELEKSRRSGKPLSEEQRARITATLLRLNAELASSATVQAVSRAPQ